MTYLARYTDKTKKFPQPADINEVDRWEIIEKICEGNSLRDINPYLVKKKLPIINDLTNLIIDGIILVYSINVTEQIYLIYLEHDKCIKIMREYKIKNILPNG